MMIINKTRKVVAEEELPMEEEVVVAPEATDLLFEVEDVAELLAEATGMPVEVEADGDQAVFTVGEDEITVQAEGDEEILESSSKVLKGKKAVAASTRRPMEKREEKAPVKSSRVIRKMPSKK